MGNRGSLTCRALSGCLGPLVFACARSAEETPPAPASDSELLDEVIVTGTRLPVILSKTDLPVIVLARVDIERGGKDSLAKILQSLPMNTGAQINTNTEAGLGAARVNLRGLGPERTLVLVNGRRFPNGGLGADASVDLNMIPLSMIERVEVLPYGASTVYGSGAVGGVVNVITRQAASGLAIGGSSSMTDHGDGLIVTADASAGFSLLGGAWSFGVDYTRQDGVAVDSRSYSARPLIIVDGNGTFGYFGQPAIPDGQFLIPDGNFLGLEPGRYTRIAGANTQTAADYRPYESEDAYNPAPYNYSQLPNERTGISLNGSVPLGESASFFLEGLLHHRRSQQQGTPSFYVGGIPAGNYYNPFGADLDFAARRFVESGVRHGTGRVDMWRAVVGFEGKLKDWNWKLAVGQSESDSTHTGVGSFAVSRFAAALGPSGPDESGRIVCGERDPVTGLVPAANVIPGCVPLNIFDGAGTITQDQLDYVNPRPIVDVGFNDLQFVEASISGPLGQVLGREMMWVLGGEYRRESGGQFGDPLRELDIANLVTPLNSRGTTYARELFAEAQIPLLHDKPGFLDSGLSLGVRHSVGDSNLPFSVGMHWKPAEAIELRANYSSVFRSGSLPERFEPQVFVSEFAPDPCGNEPTSTQRENCEANGVPGGAYTQALETFEVLLGGNPDLRPETGGSYGIGLSYAPAWAPGLSASIDYFKTELSNSIGGSDVQALLFECAQYGIADSCDRIHRNPDGSVQLVIGLYRNQGRLETSGLDFAVDWHRVTRFGEFSAELRATYLEQWDEQSSFISAVIPKAGSTGLSSWRGLGHVDLVRGLWLASYAMEYIGSMTEAVFPLEGEAYLRKIPSALYHDIAINRKFPVRSLELRIGINNVTDDDPPFVNTGALENTEPGTYRLLGRTYILELRYELQ